MKSSVVASGEVANPTYAAPPVSFDQFCCIPKVPSTDVVFSTVITLL